MFNSIKRYRKHTFFEYVACGKAVMFNTENRYRLSSKKRIKRIIDEIQEVLYDFATSFYLIEDDLKTELSYDGTSEAFKIVFWKYRIADIMNTIRKNNKLSFIELYDLALIESKKVLYKELVCGHLSEEAKAKAEGYIELYDYSIKRQIKAVLFRELVSRYNKPIIVVVDEFHPEYLYKLAENVKGIVIRNAPNKDELIDFAYKYELPMVECKEPIKNHSKIVIDNIEGVCLIKPSFRAYSKYKLKVKHLDFSTNDQAKYTMSHLSLYTVIVDDRYLDLQTNQSFFKGLGLFNSEYYYLVKGMLPTKEELVELFVKIINAFNYCEVNIKIPDFGEYRKLNYFGDAITSITDPYNFNIANRLFIEAIHEAIYVTQRKINLIAPMLRDGADIRLWKEKIEFWFEDLGEDLVPNFGAMLETEPAVDLIEYYVKSDFNIIGLDDFIDDTLEEKNRFDLISWDDFYVDLFDYVQWAHQHMRRTGIRMKHYITGNVLRNPRLFQKLINAGFTNFIIPRTLIRMAEDLNENHEKTRGRYKGVAVARREKKRIKELQKKEAEKNN